MLLSVFVIVLVVWLLLLLLFVNCSCRGRCSSSSSSCSADSSKLEKCKWFDQVSRERSRSRSEPLMWNHVYHLRCFFWLRAALVASVQEVKKWLITISQTRQLVSGRNGPQPLLHSSILNRSWRVVNCLVTNHSTRCIWCPLHKAMGSYVGFSWDKFECVQPKDWLVECRMKGIRLAAYPKYNILLPPLEILASKQTVDLGVST